jgi:hypothetical protein
VDGSSVDDRNPLARNENRIVMSRTSKALYEDPAPPDPKDLSNSARAALLGAGVQGLIFGVVKAGVDRAAARGYQAVTHESAP